MGKKIQLLSLAFFALGIFFLLNSKLNITGAIVGVPSFSQSFNIIFGVLFILVSFLIFAYSNKLEESLSDVDVAEMELENNNPVIIDTNYLIESCRDPLEYKNLMKFIRYRYDCGQPVIVPKGVCDEFKSKSNNPGEESRTENLKEALKHNTVTIEDIRGAEWGNSYIKKKSNEIAKDILYKTPKFVAYKYLSEVERREHTTVERFLGRNMGKLSTAFTENKYEENIRNAKREYDKISDRAGVRGKKNFLSTYDISPADIEVLSSALYLQDAPDIWGDQPLDKIDIITKDSHLIDSSKVFNSLYPKRKNKINIRDRI